MACEQVRDARWNMEIRVTKSLGDDYPNEQERCRKLLSEYRELGSAGTFGHAAISMVLREADEAAISGDVVRMLRAYQSMKECQ